MTSNIDGVTHDTIDAKEFAAAFALAVTEESLESDRRTDFIARYGPESFYIVLQRVFPQVSS